VSRLRPIVEIADQLGVDADKLVPYGSDKAKVDLSMLERPRMRKQPAKLVLVSAMTPTPAGEGKTTTSIGLGQAFTRLGESVCLALREPSLGPCMGMKGGGTGGGRSQLVPSDAINLHFTGDFHAITSAHNLLAAMVDNQLHFDNPAKLDVRRVAWPRVLDMNDRALRSVVAGLGGVGQGIPRQTGFDITPASEIMAILCLSENAEDLRERLKRIIVGETSKGELVRAEQIGAVGAMLALLKDAIHPNLVQSMEGTPAFVHGGPFANIAHGCNSVVATRMAMHLADWTITEAGFGFDLGAEKFFDIKCQSAGLAPSLVVLVATVRALKMHGGVTLSELGADDPAAVERGLPNLEKHLESVGHFGVRAVVALNRFETDHPDEIAVVRARCEALGVPFAESRHFAEGGEGALELARTVIEHTPSAPPVLKPIYRWNEPMEQKLLSVAQKIYGAERVEYLKPAATALKRLEAQGFGGLPVCIAKTPKSLSDDVQRVGRPEGFAITVRDLLVNAGAGFVVALTGELLRMPGLPRRPQAEQIDLVDGEIVGLR